jgi:DNA excision repair protein ERCC-1
VWGPADAPADYYPSPDTHALFLSLRYHLLKPDYILSRIRALTGPPGGGGNGGGGMSAPPPPRLRLLLCQVDVDDPGPPLEGVNVLALRAGLTLVCATGPGASARWLDLYRSLAGAPPTAIAGRAEASAGAVLAAALTGVRGVNGTDVLTLGSTFGSAAGIFSAPPSALAAVPGIGPTKARRLADAFHTPFRRPLRQTRLDAVFGSGGGGGGGGEAAPSPAPAPRRPPPPSRPEEAVVVVVEDEEEGEEGEPAVAAPPAAAAAPADAWAAAAGVGALDEFVYDDLDDADLTFGGGGGEGD